MSLAANKATTDRADYPDKVPTSGLLRSNFCLQAPATNGPFHPCHRRNQWCIFGRRKEFQIPCSVLRSSAWYRVHGERVPISTSAGEPGRDMLLPADPLLPNWGTHTASRLASRLTATPQLACTLSHELANHQQ